MIFLPGWPGDDDTNWSYKQCSWFEVCRKCGSPTPDRMCNKATVADEDVIVCDCCSVCSELKCTMDVTLLEARSRAMKARRSTIIKHGSNDYKEDNIDYHSSDWDHEHRDDDTHEFFDDD